MRWIAGFFRKLRDQFRLGFAALHVLMWKVSPARPIIDHDVRRWVELSPRHAGLLGLQSWKQFAHLLWKFPTFRNLLYYRIRRERHWPSRLLLEFARRILPRWPSLWIACSSVGPGLFIQHGFSTAIGGESIGTDCWINQQVTIGHARNDAGCGPVIGNNVRIAAGAQVLGNLTIGDNCTVAPNSYVNKSIPPNCTVAGVPAYIIRRDGKPVLLAGVRRVARRMPHSTDIEQP
jgi:serine O-acetyltransferase